MRATVLAVFILVIAFLFSCRRDKYIANVCYKENIQPILISKCTNLGCHNPTAKAAGYDFTNYDGVMQAVKPGKASQSKLYLSIRGSNPKMPKDGKALTKKEVDYIKSWINFGAENTSCGNLQCDTVSYLTFNGNIKSIIDLNCAGCHPTGHFSGHVLNSYTGVAASLNSGKFLPAIKHTVAQTQKRMPQGGGKLSDCDIAKIEKWFNNGMPQ